MNQQEEYRKVIAELGTELDLYVDEAIRVLKLKSTDRYLVVTLWSEEMIRTLQKVNDRLKRYLKQQEASHAQPKGSRHTAATGGRSGRGRRQAHRQK